LSNQQTGKLNFDTNYITNANIDRQPTHAVGSYHIWSCINCELILGKCAKNN
jgi:hypothetical protein